MLNTFSESLWWIEVITFNKEWQLYVSLSLHFVLCSGQKEAYNSFCWEISLLVIILSLNICFLLLTLSMDFLKFRNTRIKCKLLQGVYTVEPISACEHVVKSVLFLKSEKSEGKRERDVYWVVVLPQDGMINMWPKAEIIRRYYRPHVRGRVSQRSSGRHTPKHTFTARDINVLLLTSWCQSVEH